MLVCCRRRLREGFIITSTNQGIVTLVVQLRVQVGVARERAQSCTNGGGGWRGEGLNEDGIGRGKWVELREGSVVGLGSKAMTGCVLYVCVE